MRSRSRRREEGTSAIELVLYMPLLMIAIILTIQFALVYLGNQAVSASAREAARTARTTGDLRSGQARGYDYARDLGGGLLRAVTVDVTFANGDRDVRAVVSADGEQLLPFIDRPRLSEAVEGPVEQFRPDE
jgi:Flp pilus assembly protein TadG